MPPLMQNDTKRVDFKDFMKHLPAQMFDSKSTLSDSMKLTIQFKRLSVRLKFRL